MTQPVFGSCHKPVKCYHSANFLGATQRNASTDNVFDHNDDYINKIVTPHTANVYSYHAMILMLIRCLLLKDFCCSLVDLL